MLVVLVCLCLTDDGRRRRRGHSEKGIGNGARLTRDKHLARNMTYERLPWCPPSRSLSMASRRSDPSMGPFGLSGISLLYLFGQKLEWHNSRRSCKEFTERL